MSVTFPFFAGAPAWATFQIHSGGVLRQNERRIQFPAGPIPQVSPSVCYIELRHQRRPALLLILNSCLSLLFQYKNGGGQTGAGEVGDAEALCHGGCSELTELLLLNKHIFSLINIYFQPISYHFFFFFSIMRCLTVLMWKCTNKWVLWLMYLAICVDLSLLLLSNIWHVSVLVTSFCILLFTDWNWEETQRYPSPNHAIFVTRGKQEIAAWYRH